MPDERTGREIELGRRPVEGPGPGDIELGRRPAEGPGPGDNELGRRVLLPPGLEPLTNELDPASGLPRRVRCVRDGAEMVLVPAGEFIMGTSDEQVEYLVRNLRIERIEMNDEQPQRRVYLDAYYIDIYPVTYAQYGEFLAWMRRTRDHSRCRPDEPQGKDHTARFWNDPNVNSPQQPVVGVDWWDATAYAAWAGKRLPTEAEWEKAARGMDGRLWPWGDEWDDSKCNLDLAYSKYHTYLGLDPAEEPEVYWGTTPVGSYPQGVSPYGCHDMAGNVWEWCADWYDSGYYRTGTLRNPTGPESGTDRVQRGGAHYNEPYLMRCAARSQIGPAAGNDEFGFRCAQSPL